MSSFPPSRPRQELSNTYIVQDRSNQTEMERLHIQDLLTTAAMGGVLPEQQDPISFQRVLDVGCGTGDWLLETAKTYPSIRELFGVDISSIMIEYARAQAQEQQMSNRVTFQVMDALRLLEYPPDFFDLVNQRFAESFVRKWEWQKLLSEYQRVTRPGGVIRITELDANMESTSPALNRLNELFMRASSLSGLSFLGENWGNTAELVTLLIKHGLQQIQTQEHALHYRAGTPEGQRFYEDMARMYRTVHPFIRKWVRMSEEYEPIYHQALQEMQQPDFQAIWRLLTVWGNVPPKPKPSRLDRE